MNFNLQPALQNDLIILRPLLESDFESLYEVAKDPLLWEQHPNSDRYKPDVFRVFFDEAIESKGALIVIDRLSSRVIGSSRYKLIDGTETAVEIGWSFLSRVYWGGKYNKSLKTLMIDHALNYFEDIIFYIGKDNIRSQKAIEKIGGVRISEPQSLVKEADTTCTYMISKSSWFK